LAEHGIDGDYVREDVPPEAFAEFIGNLAAHGYVGANITVPHKEAAFRALARAEPIAQALKAANTVWFEKGRLVGTNTDAYGFIANFDEYAPGWDRAEGLAVVVGAGGAARAVVYGLHERGIARIVVINRTKARADSLAREMETDVTAAGFDELPRWLPDTALLVNTTTLGMAGQPALDIDVALLPAGATVYDIVYAPLETPLLVSARQRGLRTIDGLGMLLHQAVPGFERWFGVLPRVSAGLRAAVLADLAAESRK
jgi:shikimate dehydrogenase